MDKITDKISEKKQNAATQNLESSRRSSFSFRSISHNCYLSHTNKFKYLNLLNYGMDKITDKITDKISEKKTKCSDPES